MKPFPIMIGIVIVAGLSVVARVGWLAGQPKVEVAEPGRVYSPIIYRDPENGCEYVTTTHSAPLYPRLDPRAGKSASTRASAPNFPGSRPRTLAGTFKEQEQHEQS